MKQIFRQVSLIILLCPFFSLGMLAQNGDVDKTRLSEPEKRLALVIGNANYNGHPLSNPVNDAMDVAKKLENLDFEVIRQNDADKRAMNEKVKAFGQKAVESDVVLFYYSGHGFIVNGNYFCIPVNAEIKSADDLEYEGINLDYVLHAMDESDCKIKILIIDSNCDEPLTRGQSNKIPMISLGDSTIFIFSTSPGHAAMDGNYRNSPFTEALLKTLDMPNLELMNLLKRVSIETYIKAEQRPWITSTYFGDFYFNKK